MADVLLPPVHIWTGAGLRRGFGTEANRVERVEQMTDGRFRVVMLPAADGTRAEEWVRPLEPADGFRTNEASMPTGYKWSQLSYDRQREVARAAAYGVPPLPPAASSSGCHPRGMGYSMDVSLEARGRQPGAAVLGTDTAGVGLLREVATATGSGCSHRTGLIVESDTHKTVRKMQPVRSN